MYWDKFGYPEYMYERFIGNYESIYSYWWFEPEKIAALENAMAEGISLPVGEIDNKFWPNYIAAQKDISQAD